MSFELPLFLPYLLNRAADMASEEFQAQYRARYGMLRTEWRVLFHLGCYGEMTAKQICTAASLHKTKVSRAVRALEQKRYLARRQDTADRRNEWLSLTRMGHAAFDDLSKAAERYEAQLLSGFTPGEISRLRNTLVKLARIDTEGPRPLADVARRH